MGSPMEPRWCRDGCGVRIILGRSPERRWVPLEARDRRADTDEAVGCRVVVDGTAWNPTDLVEHFMARFEISEPKARELVADYPHHRPHFHEQPANR